MIYTQPGLYQAEHFPAHPSRDALLANYAHFRSATCPFLNWSAPLPANIVVSGGEVGDEAKGARALALAYMVEIFHQDASIYGLKSSGGANAGNKVHLYSGPSHAFHILPTIAAAPFCDGICVSAGVITSMEGLYSEILEAGVAGIDVLPKLTIDNRVNVSFLFDRLEDVAQEIVRSRTSSTIGSTCMGIGPTAAREASRTAIRAEIFAHEDNKDLFARKVTALIQTFADTAHGVYRLKPDEWSALFTRLTFLDQGRYGDKIGPGKLWEGKNFDYRDYCTGPYQLDEKRLIDRAWEYGRRLSPYIGSVSDRIHYLQSAPNGVAIHVLGQGRELDQLYCEGHASTATNTTPGNLPRQGIPTTYDTKVIQCFKAYRTAVGQHPGFVPWEATTGGDEAVLERVRKAEFGTLTKRQRLVGPASPLRMGHTVRMVGADAVAYSKADLLTGISTVRLEVASRDRLGHITYKDPNSSVSGSTGLTPVYVEVPGCPKPIGHIRHWADLPPEAQMQNAVMYEAMVISAGNGRVPTNPALLPWLAMIGVGAETEAVIVDAPSPKELLRISNGRAKNFII